MKKKTKIILTIVSFILLLFAGVGGYSVYKAYSFFSQIGKSREMPDEIKEARILKGAEILSKKEMFKMDEQGLLKTIGDGAKEPDKKQRQKIILSRTARRIYNFSDIKIVGNELVAVGQFGGFVFDFDGKLKRDILFEPSAEKIKIGWYEQDNYQSNLENLKIVELEKNKPGFSSFGSMQGFRVFNENGDQIWTYGKEAVDLSIIWQDEKERDKRIDEAKNVLEAAVGDLDNDGIAEYAVAVKNEGIHLFDRSGKEKWFVKDEFPGSPLQFNDFDGDGKSELFELGGNSRIFDENGKVIRELKGGDSSDAVLFHENKDKKRSVIFCDLYKNKIKCDDDTNKLFIEFDAPLSEIPKKDPKKVDIPGYPGMSYMDDSENASKPQAVWVNFKKDKPRYLAVVAPFMGFPRGHFYLYDEKGALVYHELLPENSETIAVVPSANETQEIVIGGKATIWRYAMN